MQLSEAEGYQSIIALLSADSISELTSSSDASESDQWPIQYFVDTYNDSAYQDGAASNRMENIDFKTSLSESLLMFTDKMSMAVSLEARVPLLDLKVVEFANSIPPNAKFNIFQLRKFYKETIKHTIPRKILKKKKQGFGTPISSWLKNDEGDLLNTYLNEDAIKNRGLFKKSTIDKMVHDHKESKEDYSEILVALVNLEIWFRTFID